jgi:phenylacetate-coenzyme A ligase PaaK-like adenylate-forming protein
MIRSTAEHLHTLAHLWAHPRTSRERILAFQARKLRSVVAQAYALVPHTRARFDEAGIHPADIRGPRDLLRLPITSGHRYRRQPIESLLARGVAPDRLVANVTSGSSGRPFTVLRTPIEEHLLNSFRLRGRKQVGFRRNDRIVRIKMTGLGPSKPGPLRRLRRALGIYRDHTVGCLQPVDDILAELERLRPTAVTGYPGVLTHLATRLLSAGRSLPDLRLISTGGESVTRFRRERIERGFGVRAFETYGAHEFNLMAWECPQSGLLHVCDDGVVLEVLKDGRPAEIGEEGEVVATALHSYAMPFIRYGTGDIAVRGPDRCPCGQPFSTLERVRGRAHDYFHLVDGTTVHPNEIMVPVIVEHGHWIDQYRITQHTRSSVTLKISPLHPPGAGDLDAIRRLIGTVLGDEVKATIELVDDIPSDPSAKFRLCRCMVQSELDDERPEEIRVD